MVRVFIATSNPGKLREFSVAAAQYGVDVAPLAKLRDLPGVIEDGATFEANARKKAEHYSRFVPGEMVVADDSGLAVDALGGAPGVLSARYAAASGDLRRANEARPGWSAADDRASDAANNAKLLREMSEVPDSGRTARFVCALAAARDGRTVAEFRGEVEGRVLRAPRGTNGFGYDPLFFYPSLGKTTAELSSEEKTAVSHRGRAFRKFCEWYRKAEDAMSH